MIADDKITDLLLNNDFEINESGEAFITKTYDNNEDIKILKEEFNDVISPLEITINENIIESGEDTEDKKQIIEVTISFWFELADYEEVEETIDIIQSII